MPDPGGERGWAGPRGLAIVAIACALLGVLLWWTTDEPGEPPESGEAGVRGIASREAGKRSPAAARRRDLSILAGDGASIEGRVIDPDGEPIAGAWVCFAIDAPIVPDLGTNTNCAYSDEQGAYETRAVMPVRMRVSASAPHYFPTWVELDGRSTWTPKPGEAREGVDIVLRPGAVEVRGVVRDISGGVVARAMVSLLTPRAYPGHPTGATTFADEEGAFSVWGDPGEARVRAEAPGYASGEGKGSAPGKSVAIELTPESTLGGVVVEAASGRKLAGIQVSLGPRFRASSHRYGRSAMTGADGTFRFTGLKPGRYAPRVKDERWYGLAATTTELGFVEEAGPVVIEVHPAATVDGRVVVGGEPERPCTQGHGKLTHEGTGEAVATPIEADGSLHWGGVLPGSYRVQLECVGAVAAAEYPTIEVPLEGRGDLRWEVAQGRALSGTVVDGAGVAVARAKVQATPQPENVSPKTSGSTVADHEGRFVIEGLADGAYAVAAYSPRHVAGDPVPAEIGEGAPDAVTVVLREGGVIAGRVQDATATPVTELRVRTDGPTAMTTVNRDDGTFELSGLESGDYRVTAESGWKSPLRTPGTTDDDEQGTLVTVEAGAREEVVLVVEDRDGVIDGVVESSDGPVADAFVVARRESEGRGSRGSSEGSRAKLTEADGSFSIDGLRPGTYTVFARRRGGAEEGERSGVALGETVTVGLEQAYVVRGSVRLGDGTVPERFGVLLRGSAESFRARSQTQFRTQGAWQFEAIPSGEYVVEVEADRATGTATVTVGTTDVDGIEVALTEPGGLRGRVVDLETGEPIAGLSVFTGRAVGGVVSHSPGGSSCEVGETDEGGHFSCGRVPTGRVNLRVNGGTEYAGVGVYARVEAGAVTELPDVRLPKRVDDRSGDLGYTLVARGLDAEAEHSKRTVALVRPGGPAAGSGLVAGDVIVSVGGHDVTGRSEYLYRPLTAVAPGTVVELGLEGGRIATITAAQ